MREVDIFIAGGGIAGLSAAARFAADGWSVALADPAPATRAPDDLRTTAYLQPAIETLTRAGVWQDMATKGAPLRVMRLVDAGGQTREVRETADFTAEPAGHEIFGLNVPNAAARAALLDRLAEMPEVTLHHKRSVTGYLSRADRAVLRLSDGTQIAARLAVAADGRDSSLRELAGIRHHRWAYGQQALVFCVTHEAPHQGVSTEIHRTGGPLTLVPMPDRDGRACSSVVWMMPGRLAESRLALDDAALGADLTAETMGLYGPLTLTGPRAVWPIISQVALGLTAPRLALVAEAAHVMPPIGAQGLNTSLDDIETLAGLMAGQPDPGTAALLGSYQMRQSPKILAKVAGVDLLNRAAQAESQPLRDLRRLGLAALHRLPPLRRLAVRTGLGV